MPNYGRLLPGSETFGETTKVTVSAEPLISAVNRGTRLQEAAATVVNPRNSDLQFSLYPGVSALAHIVSPLSQPALSSESWRDHGCLATRDRQRLERSETMDPESRRSMRGQA